MEPSGPVQDCNNIILPLIHPKYVVIRDVAGIKNGRSSVQSYCNSYRRDGFRFVDCFLENY